MTLASLLMGICGLTGMQLFMCSVRPRLVHGNCTPTAYPAMVLANSGEAADSLFKVDRGHKSAAENLLAKVYRNVSETCRAYANSCAHHANCPLYRHCSFGVHRNFNTFMRSTTTMMTVVTDSSWVDLLHQGMRAYPTPGAAVVFFVVVYTSFMYGLFLLFIAILLENFDTTDAEKEDIQRAALRIRVMKASPTSQIAHLLPLEPNTLVQIPCYDGPSFSNFGFFLRTNPVLKMFFTNSEDQSCHGLVDWCFF